MVDHLTPEALAAYGDTPAEATPVGEGAPVETPEAAPDAAPVTPAEASETIADTPVVAEAPAVEPVVDPYEKYGGTQRIEDAVAIAEALGSDEGIEALVREGLVALKLDPDAAFALAKGQEPPDPDALMTRAEFEEERAKDRASFEAQNRAQQEATAHSVVDSKIEAVLGQGYDDDARRMVLTYAQKYVSDPNDLRPATLESAIDKGYQDYSAAMDRAAAAYLEKKGAVRETVPQPLRGGGAPASSEAEPEAPKNMEEARAAVRRAFPGAFARD